MNKRALPLRFYRVHLHSLEVLKNEFNVPPYIDVLETSIVRSLHRALKQAGFKRYPNSWKKIKVDKLNQE